jgi:hypothetical protein
MRGPLNTSIAAHKCRGPKMKESSGSIQHVYYQHVWMFGTEQMHPQFFYYYTKALLKKDCGEL